MLEESRYSREAYRQLLFSVCRALEANVMREAEMLKEQNLAGHASHVTDTCIPAAMAALGTRSVVIDQHVELQLGGGFNHRYIVVWCDSAIAPSERWNMTLYHITNALYYYEE